MKNEKLRLLIADDQYLMLQSLKMAINTLDETIDIVATAGNGEEAIAILEKTEVDVALLDVRMPVMDGISAARVIRSRWPQIAVIMLTTFEDEEYLTQSLASGAHGYLLKNIAPELLISAIRAVKAGSVLIAPDMAGHLVNALNQSAGSGEPQKTGMKPLKLPEWFYELRPREKSIARLLLQGKTNKEISGTLNLGEQTVRNYTSSLYEKLAVSDRRDAISVLRSIEPFWFE